jgi:uncharacterized membrane protein
MSLLRLGQLIFAVSFISLAVQGMIMQDFSFGRPPQWPESIGRTMWAYVGGFIVIAAGVAVMVRRYASQLAFAAGIVIFISIFLLRNIPDLVSKELASAFWSLNAFKTLALAGGCMIVSLSFDPHFAQTRITKFLYWFAVISLAYFLFICGLAHFKFVEFITGGFIPAYIPFKSFWAYFTGICLLAGGVGLFIGHVRRLTAIMCGIMILGWFFLLHIPRMIAAPSDFLEWFGVFESLGFAGIFFVMSGSKLLGRHEGLPFLRNEKRPATFAARPSQPT